ncbi:low temperature requirement protein A [Micromonospora tulbaghiae]|uniref:Low temperature requirement protein A n=2 Tax=Micromonospora tulbaghiae TaxID=479978 RepID=A0AAW4JN45_9ACTN|nr:low temperature requirement protein A [Micromonospora tulbaghiae]KAB1905630.1 low temperature requirement protein A [Micromonospora sp. AMSO1212t]MBO4141405.1 low temperature requirement protein A [Micromonospora tulbaghiae]SCF10509.1 Low temperature requirement protein LtrA [Micromonospora tulbaghiae]
MLGSMSAERGRGRILPTAPGSRVTRVELFYDLVFVFAFLNVTNVLSETLSGRSLLAGLLLLLLLWWCWVSFAAVGNVVRTDQGVMPLVGAVTVAALFVLTLAMPAAFADGPAQRQSGPPAAVLFACCYLVIRAAQVLVFLSRSSHRGRTAVRLGLPPLTSVALILATAALPESPQQTWVAWLPLALWLAALCIEYTSGGLAPSAGLTVVSAAHWAERYALILLIALGESIISLGLGPKLSAGLPATWPVIVASVLGITIIAALWWLYFDSLAPALEQRLHRTRDVRARAALARDAYAYLHLPLITGIILFALGLKRYLTAISHPRGDPWREHAAALDNRVLFAGLVIYMLGLLALGVRATHRVSAVPTAVTAAMAVGLPWAGRLPAVAALAILAVASVSVVLLGLRSADPWRSQVRRTALDEQVAAEQEQSEWRRHHL